MELRYLEIFCKVVECRSFSKAAASLCLTQSTVSIHIKALERELSVRLLDRLGRTVTPTRAGAILYRYAGKIVRLKHEARQAIDQFTGTMKGVLEVGASTIPGEYILPRLIGEFKRAHPDVRPVLRVGDTRSIYGEVLAGRVEVGVVGSPIKDRNVRCAPFASDEMVLVAPPDFDRSALAPGELAGVALLAREEGSGSRSSVEARLAEAGVDPATLVYAASLGSTQALKEGVKSAMGLAFISRMAVAEELRSGTLKAVEVKGLNLDRSFYVITHRLRFLSPIAVSFLDFLSARP
ncbi:MAG TPA: LysR family transcriptional regulator [Deltaproteobacteria bacterium]|nr:LysR family transcriptional regulator [Deltaproteobacteria bacterium]